jgi:hypothetical protein
VPILDALDATPPAVLLLLADASAPPTPPSANTSDALENHDGLPLAPAPPPPATNAPTVTVTLAPGVTRTILRA